MCCTLSARTGGGIILMQAQLLPLPNHTLSDVISCHNSMEHAVGSKKNDKKNNEKGSTLNGEQPDQHRCNKRSRPLPIVTSSASQVRMAQVMTKTSHLLHPQREPTVKPVLTPLQWSVEGRKQLMKTWQIHFIWELHTFSNFQ